MAARRGQSFSGGSIRSGRFSFENKTAAEQHHVVIDSKSTSSYRFFNTGTTTYQVKSLTSLSAVPVEPKCSLDVKVSTKIAIVVPANSTVEGIYDYAESRAGIRNGRYVGDLVQGNNKVIIFAKSGGFYRFFNSGDNAVSLKNGGSPLVEIPTRHSLDIVVSSVVRIGTANTKAMKAEVIYDYLDTDKPVRSGRFKRTEALNPATLHQIIDFRSYVAPMGEEVPFALYRIFNSGKNPIKIVAREGGTETVLRTLEIEQSMDIGFDAAGFDDNKSIWVQSTANDKPIEGIYEFLGFDGD